MNLFGHDFYKACIAEGAARVPRELGPILGSYHPAVSWNVEQLRRISGLDEISFHMSGTEAVMQAVRLARYHTQTQIPGAVQRGPITAGGKTFSPAPATRLPPGKTYTLKEMDEDTLRVLRKRQATSPVCWSTRCRRCTRTRPRRSDNTLVDSSRKRRHFDRAAYTAWLQQLRQVCSERGIVLIVDEVFMGFRLAPGGAQEYFGVQGRHGDLWQDLGRRPAGGRGLRQGHALDEALPRKSAPPTSALRAAPSIHTPM